MRDPSRHIATRRGESRYPIKAGSVFLLKKKRDRLNRKLKVILSHRVYIWILNLGGIPEKRQPKDRKVQIFMLFVPESEMYRESHIMQRSIVQFEYICRLLKDGYEELGTVKFSYKEDDWKRFYRKLGFIK